MANSDFSPELQLRADARENHGRILRAAAEAFAREGTQASLKAIAQDAGVGIATLYRRFPTREHLVEATYRSEVMRVVDSAGSLLSAEPPLAALRAWMTEFVELLAVKYGMAETLKAALAGQEDLRAEIRNDLTQVLQDLLDAGGHHEALRTDVAASDVLLALGGISLIAGTPAQAAQARVLIDLLIDGLRFRGGDELDL